MTKLLLMLMVVGVWSGCGKEIKTHTEKYDNGKVKAKGNLVDGKQDGKWSGYYESGKVKGGGGFTEGNGKWTDYCKSGEVSWKGEYKDGQMGGKWVLYNRGGTITDEDIYEDGLCVEMCEEGD